MIGSKIHLWLNYIKKNPAKFMLDFLNIKLTPYQKQLIYLSSSNRSLRSYYNDCNKPYQLINIYLHMSDDDFVYVAKPSGTYKYNRREFLANEILSKYKRRS